MFIVHLNFFWFLSLCGPWWSSRWSGARVESSLEWKCFPHHCINNRGVLDYLEGYGRLGEIISRRKLLTWTSGFFRGFVFLFYFIVISILKVNNSYNFGKSVFSFIFGLWLTLWINNKLVNTPIHIDYEICSPITKYLLKNQINGLWWVQKYRE